MTILNTYEYTSGDLVKLIIFSLCVGLVFLLLANLCLDVAPKVKAVISVGGAVIVAAAIVVILGCTNNWYKPVVRYDITIDDTVSFNEINDKYNIIEQNGLIFTVEDK